MNILHINSDYGNTIYKSLSDELFKIGVQQKVFKFIRPNADKNINYDSYVDVSVNHKNIDRYIFFLKHTKVHKDFSNKYDKEKIDLIHSHTLFSNGYIAYKAFKDWSIPYIVTVRGTDIEIFFKYMITLRKLGIKILENASKIIFLSVAHRKKVISKYVPMKKQDKIFKKTAIIPNGVDSLYLDNKFNAHNLDPEGTIDILTTGWINNNKNQVNVLKAIEILNGCNKYKFKYNIVGGRENSERYKKVYSYLDSSQYVEIIPRLSKEELINIYRENDIFILASHKETFGLSYIEALSQGLPILYSEGRGIDGYFKEGQKGFSLDPDNPEDIANKIEKIIIEYPNIKKDILINLEQFEWKNVAMRTYCLYKEVISSK